jgi:putative inorganic carbon (HCO3(-)) transporter
MPSSRLASLFTLLELALVAVLALLGVLTERLLPLAALVAILFWPLRWALNRRPTLPTPANLPILILLLMLPVSLWASPLPEKTLLQALRLLVGILLFYALLNGLVTLSRLLAACWASAGLSLLLSLAALVSVNWPQGKIPLIPARLVALFPPQISDTVHANVMAGALALLLPFPLAAFLWNFSPLKSRLIALPLRLTALLIAACVAAVLLLTQSRGGYLAAVAALVVLLTLRLRRWGWLVPLACAALSTYLLWRYPNALEILASGSGAANSLEVRQEIWSRALFIIRDFPLTGIGMGLFTEVADALYPFFLSEPGAVSHAHNLLLQIAVDLGLPGLIAWLALLIVVIAGAWRAYRCAPTAVPHLSSIGAALLATLAALLVHGLFDAVAWGLRPAVITWGVFGMAVAAGHLAWFPAPQKSSALAAANAPLPSASKSP